MQMPKAIVQQALALSKESVLTQELLFEATIHGIALLISVNTDSRNRTVQQLRHLLSKFDGSMGGPNSVKYLFDQRGVIRIGIKVLLYLIGLL